MFRNNEQQLFLDALVQLHTMLKSDNCTNKLIDDLKIDLKLKQCLADFVFFAKQAKSNGHDILSDISITMKITNDILNRASSILVEVEKDPINFNYINALERCQNIKYEIAKELRDYVE